MSLPSNALMCPSALLNYAHFAGAVRPDNQGRAPCPLCGKTVQLMARGRVPQKTYIPRHKRAQP